MAKRVLLLLLWAIAACVIGCDGGSPVISIPSWTLTIEGTTTSKPVTLPIHLDADLPRRPARYTLTTFVAVPPDLRGRPLTLAIPHLPALAWLNVNGREMVSLDTGLTDRYRGSGHPRWRIPADASNGEQLSLEIVVDHRWTQSGWIDGVPRLSASVQGDGAYLIVRTFNELTAVGALTTTLFVFFAYAIIFTLDRRRAAYGWFTLEALASGVYPAFQLGLLQPLLSVYDGPAALGTLALATVAGAHFTHAQLKRGSPPRWLDLSFLGAVGAAIAAGGPFMLTRYAAPIAVASIALNLGYQIQLVARATWRGQQSARAMLLLASLVTVMLTASVDLAAWLGAGEILGGLRTACLGIMIIAIAQSAELSIEHIYSLGRADELNAQLAERLQLLEAKHREVEVLNEELRFQVTSRSDQLAQALSRVGTPHGRIRPLEPDEIIEARYRVIRHVGEGAMGAVYEVERLTDKRRLALKMLTDISGGLNVARFAREAQIVSQISHPNVIAIVDVDISSSGFFYMVMEFIDGLSLRQQQERYSDTRWVISVLRQIAEGLSAIHARGVVHRDLKPGNILVTAAMQGGEPLVKIADFGISALESAPGDDDIISPPKPRDSAPTRSSPGALPPLPEIEEPPSSRDEIITAVGRMQHLKEGLPPSLRDVLPPGGAATDGRPQSLPEGMPPSLRGILGTPPAARDSKPRETPEAPPAALDPKPRETLDVVHPARDDKPRDTLDVVHPARDDKPRDTLDVVHLARDDKPRDTPDVVHRTRDNNPRDLLDLPPPTQRTIPPAPPMPSDLGDALPSSLRDPASTPKSVIPPPNQRSLADKIKDRMSDTWDTGPVSSRGGPGSIRPGPGSIRPGPGSIRPGPGSIRPAAMAKGGSPQGQPVKATLPSTDEPLTQAGALMGTPIYMAPELAGGVKFAKPSADIFSLGVIGYELLTGKSPFAEPPALMRLANRTIPPPAPLSHLCPKLDRKAAAILQRCLAYDPAERPTAREIADELALR